MKNTVGKNIVKLRKEQGMSQEQLAQKLHAPGRPCPIGKQAGASRIWICWKPWQVPLKPIFL